MGDVPNMADQNPIKVIVIDDHDMVRRGLAAYFKTYPTLNDMLQGAKSVDIALTNAQNRADALMRARGHY